MSQPLPSFAELGLSDALLRALSVVGYETPSPIQAQSIPPLLAGRDVLGQAQTGTGKTAAFALPLLQQLDLKGKSPQVLVLTPTRELAIQVAEAFQTYAQCMPGFHILPIYGGQAYPAQIKALKRGVHVVVGTPGRVMDHMRKGTLKLDSIRHFVLDEADEMLRMGFIDDVEWILAQAPTDRQIALFSATMPKPIAKVANTYLVNPQHVKIDVKTTAAKTIRQRYWAVNGLHKLDALTRILEVEPFDAMIIFVRTKTATVELAEKLEARGYSAAALNGDISQVLRERTVEKLKNGQVDLLVATDVAARGLDVERISHVFNYDIPYDSEAYVHRIGRTGRAGRSGEAILFVAQREIRMLRAIERATGQSIEAMTLPSTADINEQRVQKFKRKLSETLASQDLMLYQQLVQDFQQETDTDPVMIAAALAVMAQGEQPLLLKDRPAEKPARREEREPSARRDRERPAGERERPVRERPVRERAERAAPAAGAEEPRVRKRARVESDVPMDTYRLEVGRADGVKPGEIVGAIANEADIDSQFIGYIKINDDHSTVQLPTGMPPEVLKILHKARVCQKPLRISLLESESPAPKKSKPRARKP